MYKDAPGYTKESHRKMMSELLDQPERLANVLKVYKSLKGEAAIKVSKSTPPKLTALVERLKP